MKTTALSEWFFRVPWFEVTRRIKLPGVDHRQSPPGCALRDDLAPFTVNAVRKLVTRGQQPTPHKTMRDVVEIPLAACVRAQALKLLPTEPGPWWVSHYGSFPEMVIVDRSARTDELVARLPWFSDEQPVTWEGWTWIERIPFPGYMGALDEQLGLLSPDDATRLNHIIDLTGEVARRRSDSAEVARLVGALFAAAARIVPHAVALGVSPEDLLTRMAEEYEFVTRRQKPKGRTP